MASRWRSSAWWLLARDGRRRRGHQAAQASRVAVRRAMENPRHRPARARDAEGRVTLASTQPSAAWWACAHENLRRLATAPLATHVENYLRRNAERRAGLRASTKPPTSRLSRALRPSSCAQKAVSASLRASTRPFRCADAHGRQTGLMSTVLDIRAASCGGALAPATGPPAGHRPPATVGEMASLLQYQLNQPLAAIASYANGSLNPCWPTPAPPSDTAGLVRQGAGAHPARPTAPARVIKSVHDRCAAASTCARTSTWRPCWAAAAG